MPFLVIGDVEPDELLEAAIRIENLNASIAAVGHVDVPLAIDLHVVWISKLAWAGPVRSPGLDPVSVLVHLGDARIDVAVANIDVVFCVPRHIGRPVIQPINRALFRRSGSPELEALVSFRPAAQIHQDVAGRAEFHDRVRAFIDNPQVVVPVEPHGVRIS